MNGKDKAVIACEKAGWNFKCTRRWGELLLIQ